MSPEVTLLSRLRARPERESHRFVSATIRTMRESPDTEAHMGGTSTGGASASKPFYLFIDLGNPMAMNLQTVGMAFSTPLLPDAPDWLDVLEGREPPGALSPFIARVLSSPSMRKVEAAAEAARRRYAPNAPSRTTALFAFRDLESVRLVVDRHGWDLRQVQEFVPNGRIATHRVDMEFMSAAQAAADRQLWLVDEESWWRGYWAGEPHPEAIALTCLDSSCPQPASLQPLNGEPIWEWLIEGWLRPATSSSSPK